jgi:arginine utilization protein RocB
METMIKLVKVPGISGTESENMTSDKLYELIAEIPYFNEHPNNLRKIQVEGDILKRNFVSAFLKSKTNKKKTIILNGHFDVVGIEEYGHLKDIAFDPIEFTKRVSELTLDEDTKNDLQTGEWLFGRGTADMKFGIALCIELLREYSLRSDLEGNILFLGVPGEESNSEGMIGALKHIKELQNINDLEYEALLLPECYMPENSMDKVRYIHYGACGKIMPMFFFAGKEMHASEPFEGINPNLMAAELNRLFELNVDFCDIKRGVTAPPPICLKLSDLKELYSVQTPIYAVSYYNLITLNLDLEKLSIKLKTMCMEAFSNSINILNERKAVYEKTSGYNCTSNNIEISVMFYDELYKKVKELYGEEFDNFINSKISAWKACKLENQEISINIIKETYERYPNKVPMIVIAFTPPYYPDRYSTGGKASNLLKVIDETISYANIKYNEVFKKKDYYLGICDMSYTGLEKDEEIKMLSNNMPGINKNYILPIEQLKEIDIPAIVLGGYGKDCHKYTERLYLPYSFDILPDLYLFVINRLLK